jgi:hypothetical protein
MPVVLLVLSTLLFWVIYWFIRMGGIEHLQQRAAQRKEEARRQQAREAARLVPLRAIDDPRDAATILMLLIARHQGDPTREQIALIESKLRSVFGFEHELTERMTQARFIARQADDFEQAGIRVRRLVQAAARDCGAARAHHDARRRRAPRGCV